MSYIRGSKLECAIAYVHGTGTAIVRSAEAAGVSIWRRYQHCTSSVSNCFDTPANRQQDPLSDATNDEVHLVDNRKDDKSVLITTQSAA